MNRSLTLQLYFLGCQHCQTAACSAAAPPTRSSLAALPPRLSCVMHGCQRRPKLAKGHQTLSICVAPITALRVVDWTRQGEHDAGTRGFVGGDCTA